MAITTINSASSLYEGSSAAEVVQIESGAASFTTVNAAGGNDSITFLSAGNAATQTSLNIDANAGADEITISGQSLSLFSSTVIGGAGGDTIILTGAAMNYVLGDIKAGDGSDLVDIGGVDFSGSTFNLGAGADTLFFSGNGNGLSGVEIAGGSGADEITLSGKVDLTASTILGGGGADAIVLSGEAGAGSLINGDSTVNGGGADTITLAVGLDGSVALGASATIKGKGGADEINIEGSVGASARVEGNAGADNIIVSGAYLDKSFIGAGSGNDTVSLGTLANGSAASIKGGGGADYIDFISGASYNGSGTRIYGGAGQDTIDLGQAFTGDVANRGDATGTIAFEALTDSSLDSIDEIAANALISGLTFAIDTAAGITSFTVGAYSDSDSDTPTITTGVADNGTWASADSTVTARVEQLDDLVGTKGTLVQFQANNVEYLFIQGGSEGTSDDAVIELPEAISGSIITTTDYEFSITFDN